MLHCLHTYGNVDIYSRHGISIYERRMSSTTLMTMMYHI